MTVTDAGDEATDSGVASEDSRVPYERGVESVGAFEFERGGSIPDLELAYERHGEYTGDNAVLVCHALTGSAHVATDPAETADDTADDGWPELPGRDTGGDDQARAWWDAVVGPGKAIDTTQYHVVCVNVPGSCYGSTGPASTNPETGEPYGTDFPDVTVADWTRAQRALLDAFGIDHLHAVVGGSVGGMNALEWAARYPDRVGRVAPIATAARLDPQCLALDAVARRAITGDPAWDGGDYYGADHPTPTQGLAQARQLGHVMYLSKDSMAERFGRRPASVDVDTESFTVESDAEGLTYRDVESYLDYRADSFVDRFDANAYLALTNAMDEYDLRTGHGAGHRIDARSDAEALADFDGEALLLSFTGDWHFTVEASESLAEAFREATGGSRVAHHVVDSDYGHDAFLVESESVGPPLAAFLDAGVDTDEVTDTQSERPVSPRFAPVHSGLISD